MIDILNLILIIIGKILVVIGLICDLAASILMIRFPNFYVRLHALTVGSIGGAFVPMIGAGLIALGSTFLGNLRWFLAGGSFTTAFFTFILGGAGSHAIARATYRSKSAVMKPCYVDQLAEDKGGTEC
ncbi:MAG: monovalent cation/H(+) antiporter subunit G [Desulfurococcaceae archaeon]